MHSGTAACIWARDLATQWHRGLAKLSNPLSTDIERAVAVTSLTTLHQAGHQCPREIAQPVRRVLGTLRSTSDSVAFADACDALAHTLPGACITARIGPTPASVDARSIDHPDASNFCAQLVNAVATAGVAAVATTAPVAVPAASATVDSASIVVTTAPVAVPAANATIDSASIMATTAPVAVPTASATVDKASIVLEDLDHDATSRPHKRKPAWTPGKTTVGWVSRGRRIELQSQVLVINGHKRLSALPFAKRSQLRSWLQPLGSLKSTTVASQILSGILRLSARTIEAIVQDYKVHGHPRIRPVIRGACRRLRRTAPSASPCASASAPTCTSTDALAGGATAATEVVAATAATDEPRVPPGFLNLVRAAQFLSSHGIAKLVCPGLLNLIAQAKG